MSKFNPGQTFADGDTVTGAKLNNITGLLNIYTGLISEQTAMSATVSTADQLLIADTDNGDSGAANRITVKKLFNDALTNGTYTNANLSGSLTVGNLSTTLAGDFTISQGTGTLGSSGVISGTYGTTNVTPRITIDSKGRITSATALSTNYTIRTELSSTTTGSSGSELVGFISSSTGATGRTAQSKLNEIISVKDFGATGDGSTDDSTAIQNAIISTIGKTLYFPPGNYIISTSPSNNASGIQLGTTLTANTKWIGDSASITCNSSSHRSHMVYMNCGGYSMTIEGISFNSSNKSLNCVRVDSSNFESSAYISGCQFRNTLALTSAGVGGFISTGGIRFLGAFESVIIKNCVVDSIDRVAGAGIPGSSGSNGILIGAVGTNYTKFSNVSSCRISNITCQDTGNDANNVDCDGLAIFHQVVTSGSYTPARSSIYENSFVNCKGRDIKLQIDEGIVSGNTSYRNILPTSGGFNSINCQFTSGNISNNMFHLDSVAGTPDLSPFYATGGTDPSSSIVAFYEGTSSSRARSITVSNNMVFNNVAEATGVLDSFYQGADGHSTGSSPMYVTISGNKISGGACNYFAYPTLRSSSEGAAYHTISDNSATKLVTSFLVGSATAPTFGKNIFSVHGNRNDSSAVRHLVNSSTPTSYYGSNFSAFNNTNIGLDQDSAGNYPTERNTSVSFIPRFKTIGDPDTNEGGIISVQSVIIASGASYSFPYRGYVGYGSFRMLTCSIGDAGSAMFRHGSNVLTSVSIGANVSLGTTSDPGVASNVNIWCGTSQTIDVTNRLATSRTFTLFTLG